MYIYVTPGMVYRPELTFFFLNVGYWETGIELLKGPDTFEGTIDSLWGVSFPLTLIILATVESASNALSRQLT